MGLIRKATIDDLEAVVKMALKFASASPYKDVCHPKIMELRMAAALTSDMSVVFIADDRGMIVGQMAPFFYGTTLVASELGWWVEPEYRKQKVGIELLNRFEAWALEKGCKYVTMISIDDAVERVYQKLGYTLFERAYMKELT